MAILVLKEIDGMTNEFIQTPQLPNINRTSEFLFRWRYSYKWIKKNDYSRHVIVFRILPIRCARNRDFKTWESRLARGLLLFNKLWNIQLVDGAIFTIVNYAICWPNLLETLYHKAFANSAFLQSLYLYFDSPKA